MQLEFLLTATHMLCTAEVQYTLAAFFSPSAKREGRRCVKQIDIYFEKREILHATDNISSLMPMRECVCVCFDSGLRRREIFRV